MSKKRSRKPKKPAFLPKVDPVEVETDNPMFMKDHKADRTNPLRIRAVVNANESPIVRMAVRGQLTHAQTMAASEFRKLWEQMGGAGVKAMDYSKTRVDGGGSPDPISIRQMDAGRKLNALRKYVGRRHYDVLVKVVGQGIEIARIGKSQREKLTLMDYLKDGLEDAAEFWGMRTKEKVA